MSGIDISRPLSGNLGAGGTFLVDLEASINEKLAKSNCPDEVRSVVALKIKKISELLIQLYNINTLNLPNEEKRQKVQELLGGTEIKDFLQCKIKNMNMEL